MITLASTHAYAHGETLANSVIKTEIASIRRNSPIQLRVSFYRNVAAANGNKATIQPDAADPLAELQVINIPFATLGTYNTPALPKFGAALEQYLEDQVKAKIQDINTAAGSNVITFS